MADFDQFTGVQPSVQDMSKDMGLKRFLLGIYQKMALGLVITGATSWAVANTEAVARLLYTIDGGYITGYTPLGMGFAFAPLVLVLISNFFMRNVNAATMGLFYWIFVAVMGVSLSSVCLMYTGTSIASTFFVTAAAFGALSIAGYTTKINMSGWGSFLFMAVIGLLVLSVVNWFLGSPMISWIIGAAGVLIFSALIAYKTQWLKNVYYELQYNQAGLAAMTYYGALSLYISFINLFLSLLRLMGGRR